MICYHVFTRTFDVVEDVYFGVLKVEFRSLTEGICKKDRPRLNQKMGGIIIFIERNKDVEGIFTNIRRRFLAPYIYHL